MGLRLHSPFGRLSWYGHGATTRIMADTIFKKIIAGELACHKLYEDEEVLAFLDINPLSEGHALVIPKEAAETLDQLSDEASAAIGRVLPRLCRALMSATGVSQYNVLQNNGPMAHQAVDHVHFHIIPRPNIDKGLGVGWKPGKLDDATGHRIAAAVMHELRT